MDFISIITDKFTQYFMRFHASHCRNSTCYFISTNFKI